MNRSKFKLYPYVNRCIKDLKKKKIKIGIVTSGLKRRLINSVPKKFLDNFDVIITGEDTKYGKPSKDPFSKGIVRLNLMNKNCLAIENAPLGITSAKKAGLFCIAITSTLDKKYLINADIRVSSFKELFTKIFIKMELVL